MKKVCKTFKLTNPTKIPVLLKSLYLKDNRARICNRPRTYIQKLPYTMAPGETMDVEVCATALVESPQPVKDSIIAVMTCYPETIVGLQLRTGKPDIMISDADWGQVPVGVEKPHSVTIQNIGTVDAEIYTIDWTDKVHFTRTDLDLSQPLKLTPGETIQFTAYYKPSEAGVRE